MTKQQRLIGLAVIAVLMLLVMPLVTLAQGGGQGEDPAPVREVTDDEVNEVSSKLYCPVCENVPLDVCGTAACARWRAQVRTLLEQGEGEDAVIAYFVEQFGDRVVGTPQDPLLNFFSWFVPIVAVVLGLGVVGVVLVRWRAVPAPVAVEDDPDEGIEDADYRERLERELGDFE